jgi:hypothetical protein
MDPDFILFEERKEFRLNKEISKMLDFLLDRDPAKYENISHLIRCLIVAEYNRAIHKKIRGGKNG